MVDKDQSEAPAAEIPVEPDKMGIRRENRLFGVVSIGPHNEKRREERYPLPVHLELSRLGCVSNIPECAILRNMSENGVALEHSLRLEVGEIVSVKLLDVPVDLPCEYSVEILWQKPKPNNNGVFTSGGRILSADEVAPPAPTA